MNIFSMIMHIAYMILGVEPMQKFPEALSAEEERECFKKCRAGDMKARDKLIEHNLRLVAHIVRKYYISNKNTDIHILTLILRQKQGIIITVLRVIRRKYYENMLLRCGKRQY